MCECAIIHSSEEERNISGLAGLFKLATKSRDLVVKLAPPYYRGRLLTRSEHGLHLVNHSVIKIWKVKSLPPSVSLRSTMRNYVAITLLVALFFTWVECDPRYPKGERGGDSREGKCKYIVTLF